MTKKNKLLVTSFSVAMAATIGCMAIALMPKTALRAFGETDEVWNHYSERMPGVRPGVKEYWVSCKTHTYSFSAPAEGQVVDQTGWDTTGFEADDERYTYQCTKKIADSAIKNSSATSEPLPGEGFAQVQVATYAANDNQGLDLDISNYDYVTFGLCHNLSYLHIFGGDGGQGDNVEACIANNVSFTMWSGSWYYFTLERNAEGKWDAYVGKFATAKRASASLKMAVTEKSATNLKDIVRLWTWATINSETDKLYSTEVYAGEKGHHYVWDNSKISPVEIGTCPLDGATSERPAAAVDFTSNVYGAKLYNKTAETDVGSWTTQYNGGTFFHVNGPTELSYLYYQWNLFEMSLPRIDFTKYSQVSFDLASVLCNPTDPAGGSTWKIGFSADTIESFASTVSETLDDDAKLSFTTYSGKVVAKITSFGSIAEKTFDITDVDVINGTKSVILYVQCTFNSSSNAIQLSNLQLVEKPDAASIADTSIKEIQLNKQVRRVEQEDHWKTDADYSTYNNESGHADYFKLGNREVIHFSAHYASDDPKFGYNSGWSEWRFAHAQAGLKSVTFTYLYEESNTDTSNDGSGDVHTMAQWYDGSTYKARSMTLVSDGNWHTATVTGDAFDATHFVMKIYHFTGDIYISNIRYSDAIVPVDEASIADTSIKEVQLNKQVRRVEQQDAWKSPIGSASDEAGHAEYVKYGTRDAIHFSAHYDSIIEDKYFKYNSGWSEWRFTHSQANLTSVTFTYLYQDSNTDTSNDGSGDVHTMAQWYGAAYQARTMTLVNDGQWHTITVTGAAYDITHFVMKIYHFTGDIYISNIIYSTSETDVTDASIKEIQLNKQVRRVEQQDHWKTDPDYSTYNNESGHAEYVKCGTRDAIHFSAHYASTDPEFSYNSSWSEWRFTHAVSSVNSVTFTYLYEDSNTDTSNDGSGDVHTMAQWYNDNANLTADSKYLAASMNLVNDGEWHTITVTADGSFDITHFVMKIYHFTGDIYISNIIYA